jgi:hypothetical protein
LPAHSATANKNAAAAGLIQKNEKAKLTAAGLAIF